MTLPAPVKRTLRRLGQDISIARRVRRWSQDDLAQRIGTSLSTVRRMEDGYPGTALHSFLWALHVLGRLNAMAEVLALENDALSMELAREQLPQRVRSSRRAKQGRRTVDTPDGRDDVSSEELEEF